jgi:hypothetical protein
MSSPAPKYITTRTYFARVIHRECGARAIATVIEGVKVRVRVRASQKKFQPA